MNIHKLQITTAVPNVKRETDKWTKTQRITVANLTEHKKFRGGKLYGAKSGKCCE